MGNGYASPTGDGLGVIREEISELRRRVAELETPTAAQMYGTTDQAAALAAAVVLPVAVYRLDSPLVTASLTEFAVVETEVPEGFSRALVQVTATASLKSNEAAGAWGLLTVSAAIGGAAVNTGRSSVSGQMYGTASSSRSQVLTGLVAGDTVRLSAFASFPNTYTVPSVSVAGSILFLK